MAYFSWVFTAYILAASIPAVVVGRVSDVYGRKPFILAGLIVFSIGSWLCGLSESIVQLILFRAVQGIGGGIIMATTFAAVGDLFVPRERGKWQGMLGAMFGLASVFGSALGVLDLHAEEADRIRDDLVSVSLQNPTQFLGSGTKS